MRTVILSQWKERMTVRARESSFQRVNCCKFLFYVYYYTVKKLDERKSSSCKLRNHFFVSVNFLQSSKEVLSRQLSSEIPLNILRASSDASRHSLWNNAIVEAMDAFVIVIRYGNKVNAAKKLERPVLVQDSMTSLEWQKRLVGPQEWLASTSSSLPTRI